MWSQINKIIIIGPGSYEKKFNNHPTPMITIIYHEFFFSVIYSIYIVFLHVYHLSYTCLLLLSFQFVYFCSSSSFPFKFFWIPDSFTFSKNLRFQVGIKTRTWNLVWWIHERFVAPKFFLGFTILANFSLQWFHSFDSRSLHYESITSSKF